MEIRDLGYLQHLEDLNIEENPIPFIDYRPVLIQQLIMPVLTPLDSRLASIQDQYWRLEEVEEQQQTSRQISRSQSKLSVKSSIERPGSAAASSTTRSVSNTVDSNNNKK